MRRRRRRRTQQWVTPSSLLTLSPHDTRTSSSPLSGLVGGVCADFLPLYLPPAPPPPPSPLPPVECGACRGRPSVEHTSSFLHLLGCACVRVGVCACVRACKATPRRPVKHPPPPASDFGRQGANAKGGTTDTTTLKTSSDFCARSTATGYRDPRLVLVLVQRVGSASRVTTGIESMPGRGRGSTAAVSLKSFPCPFCLSFVDEGVGVEGDAMR